jgi:hypothetical protein
VTHNIAAWIKTEPVVDEVYRITVEWAVPAPGDNADKHLQIVTNRFADELRKTIETHQNA